MRQVILTIAPDIALVVLCPHADQVHRLEIPYDAKVHSIWFKKITEWLEEHKDCNMGPRPKTWICAICDGGPGNQGSCGCPNGPVKQYE